MLLPVATSRLIVRLPVFAVKTYFPALVIQHGAACPALITSANPPLRNSPS
jgi:hypothetical protein